VVDYKDLSRGEINIIQKYGLGLPEYEIGCASCSGGCSGCGGCFSCS